MTLAQTAPWRPSPGGLVVPRTLLDALLSHARAAAPDECCGLLTGPAEGPRVDAAERFENLADRYHAHDPVAFPRTARTAYVIHGVRFVAAVARAAAEGRAVKAIYHSHPGGEPRFSPEDEAFARADEGLRDALAWLVLTTERAVGLFAYDPARNAFTPAALTVAAR